MVLSLIEVAKNKPAKAEQKQKYWNTWHCQTFFGNEWVENI